MVLNGKLGFLPMDAKTQKAGALSKAKTTIAITLRGTRIELPPAQ